MKSFLILRTINSLTLSMCANKLAGGGAMRVRANIIVGNSNLLRTGIGVHIMLDLSTGVSEVLCQPTFIGRYLKLRL